MFRSLDNQELKKNSLIILLSVILVLFSQYCSNCPITTFTFYGLGIIFVLCLLGVICKQILFKINFPVLAWVSTLSLIICLPFFPFNTFIIKSLNGVNFLAITTPILVFAGISVANKLGELKKISWKIFIVALFVFFGRFLLSAIFSQIVLMLYH